MHVLGPLPLLYKYLVCVTAIVICMVAGAWAAFMLPYPVLVVGGASVGLAVGAVFAFVLLHEFANVSTSHLDQVRRTPLH